MKAIIIKGNPEFVENNPAADEFYENLVDFLVLLGYEVSIDIGEPYTQPVAADVWIGHSRGADRLRFAPPGTKTISVGIEGGINHPQDTSLSKGKIPDKFHYILTQEMKDEIRKILER